MKRCSHLFQLLVIRSLLLAHPIRSLGQAAPPQAQAAWSGEAFRLDGILDEPAWLRADSVTTLIQLDPAEGQPASEHSAIRFVATVAGLYVGFWGYDSSPREIRHAQLRRDADFESDDSFTLLVDPQRDHRSGYIFSVNPNGARFDAEIVGPEESNSNWDGVWDARARLTASGWTAEIFIPWPTLRYQRHSDRWGVNLRRFIRRKNEENLWTAWKRQQGLLFQEAEGVLVGLTGLPPRGWAELRPYVASTGALRERTYQLNGHDSVVAPAVAELKIGADVKLAPAPTLTLDLTANTDFAQVEADRQVVNLTRFPLFFPEKRPFFLEGSGIFDFGQAERTQLFYSRRIGLDNQGMLVPLAVGARLQGRVGPERIGVLAIRTGTPERAVDLVGRIKHDVLSRGYAGAELTAQSTSGAVTRLGFGADFELPFLVGGQNLVLAGFGAGTKAPATSLETAWRLFLDYPNDWSDNFLALNHISEGFDPALGFVRETGIWRHTGAFRIFPRPHRLGIRRLAFTFIEWDVTTDLSGELAHSFYEVRPLGATFESGDELELNVQRFYDVPTESFEIFPGSAISAGRYRYDRVEVQFSSSAGRPLALDLVMSAGDFYDGTAVEIETGVKLRPSPHLTTEVEYTNQTVRRPDAGFTARAARLRLDLAATPRLGSTLFVQWENESKHLSLNARFHWIPRAGSDAYLVWNSAWPTDLGAGIPWSRPLHGALIGKVVFFLKS